MKQLSLTQLKLLTILGDGLCHSGNELGVHLAMSRSAIWKQIHQLTAWGITINSIAHRGYQLSAPVQLLNEAKIREALSRRSFEKPIDLHLFSELDSTNRYLKEASLSPSLSVCLAEKQTNGRGRFGRQWVSPFGENIYFTGRWQWQACLSKLSGLSLVISLAVLAALQGAIAEHGVLIKWPNDLLWDKKKLAGVLIEVNAESNGQAHLIIGIGININTQTQNQPLTDEKPWCSLYEITGRYFDRNTIIADLIGLIDNYLEQFKSQGFTSFHQQWQQVDYLQNKWITVSQPSGTLYGQALGVNEGGLLLLQDEQGNRHELSSGDTTLSGAR